MQGKSVIVTGSGHGIGRAIALAFAQAGASVALVDIREEALRETVRQIEEAAGSDRALPLVRDITAPGVPAEIVRTTAERFGGLHCLVNNAADQSTAPLEAITDEHYDHVQAVNVRAALFLAKEAVPYLAERPGASIVNIASQVASLPLPGRIAYCTSKAAMVGLTRSLAVEIGPRGIRVNAILPGHIMSFGEEAWKQRYSEQEQRIFRAPYPLGRCGYPEEIASVAVFLASDGASFIHGASIVVDGGFGVASPETAAEAGAQVAAE